MIEALTLEGALYIVKNMRSADRSCIQSMAAPMSDNAFALNRWQTHGASWQMLQDDLPVCMAGVAELTPWIASAWMVSVDGMSPKTIQKLMRFSRIVFGNASDKYQRLECTVLSTWPQARRYAEKLGFKLEGIRCKAGRDGQDVLVFVYEKPKD